MPGPRKTALTALLCALALTATACAQGSSRSVGDLGPALTAPQGLTFMGGVVLTSDRTDFGGFSGLWVEAPGTLIALTDKVHWFRGTLEEDASGRLRGWQMEDVGRLYATPERYLDNPRSDSEALVRAADGSWLVSFERDHRISRFETLKSPEEVLPVPAGFADLALNGGIEALAQLPDGRLVAIAEAAIASVDTPGWLIGKEGVERFEMRRSGGFSPTDLALSPDGTTLYLLERRFTLIGGISMRLSRFAVESLQPGARVEAETLMVARHDSGVDNMEGLATTRDADGRDMLYIISDDNFSARQRTLLLKYRVEN